MTTIKLAAGVLNQVPLDWDGNRDRILAAVREARAAGVGILCLPELCITGYGCEDAFLSLEVVETGWRVLEEIAPECRGLLVSVGHAARVRNALYNTAAVIVDGRITGFVAKQYLAGDGLHYEPRWFKPWPAGRVAEVEWEDREYPIGDLYLDVDGVGIGFEVCEDAWVATRPGGGLAARGVDVILNPSASHFAFGKQPVRERYVLEGSRSFGVSYVYTNPVGNEAGRSIYDGGALIATAGRVVARAPRFGFAPVQLTTAVVDLDLTRLGQAQLASFRPELGDDGGRRIELDFELPRSEEPATDTAAELPAWETAGRLKEEELARSVSLGLFDYLRKSRSCGFVVSLSGGADSAACACLAAMALRMAWRELGPEGLRRALSHVPGIDEVASPEALVDHCLTTVYQATRNSSDTTRSAAAAVGEALGARHHELEIDDLVEGYVDRVEAALGRELTWERDDVALQNIQARVRAPAAWLFANLGRALLLTTSNRSEAAVGYATMDGDTAGGLAPIAGIDKAYLRRWLSWLETEGPSGLGPVPALAAVNAQAPTAELRPPAESQTDEGDLMPYDLLDAIERAAIRDKKGPLAIHRRVVARFPSYSPRQLGIWVERFFRLWSRNQWKRERYAPSFHLDDESLDPKTWCRFPILSGGYERELAALRRHLERAEPAPVVPSG